MGGTTIITSGTTIVTVPQLNPVTSTTGNELFYLEIGGSDPDRSISVNQLAFSILNAEYSTSIFNAPVGSGSKGFSINIAAGSGDGFGQGGDVNINGGNSTGLVAAGNLNFTAGLPTVVNGSGGSITLQAGFPSGVTPGSGGGMTVGTGHGYGVGHIGGGLVIGSGFGFGGAGAGNLQMAAGDSDTLPGGNVTIKSGTSNGGGGQAGGAINLLLGAPSDTTGVPGQFEINGNSSIAAQSLRWQAGANPANTVLFTATRKMLVTSILGRLEIAQGAAATVTIVKAPSGTAFSAGTALHTGSFNANGTPATNQTLPLAASFPTLTLNPGDSIGVQTTGTWTTSVGGVTVHMAPQ